MKSSPTVVSQETEKTLTKKCSSCKKVKDATDFYKDKTKSHGLSSRCKECSGKARLAYQRDNLEVVMFTSARKRARKKGLDFDITVDDIVIPHRCPCLDIVLKANEEFASDSSPSLDRIDSSKGYTKDNIWVVSKRANTIMSNATPAELHLIAARLDAKLLSVEQEKKLELSL